MTSFNAKAAKDAKENNSLNAKAAKDAKDHIENQPKNAKTTPSGVLETLLAFVYPGRTLKCSSRGLI